MIKFKVITFVENQYNNAVRL